MYAVPRNYWIVELQRGGGERGRGAWQAGRAERAGQETVCNQALAPAAIRAVEEGADLVSGSRNCGSGAGHGQLDPQHSRNFNHDASAAHGGDVGIRVGRQTGALQERRLSLAGESVVNGRVAESHRHSLCARARDDARDITKFTPARLRRLNTAGTFNSSLSLSSLPPVPGLHGTESHRWTLRPAASPQTHDQLPIRDS
jgi:hypothetical protein